MMIDIVIELFFIAMIIACIAAFIVTLLHKWGAVEYMQVHADDFPEVVNKLFECDFCLSWWVSVIISIVFAITMSYFDEKDGIRTAQH